MVAAQDRAISTNYFRNKNFKEKIYSKYQLCKQPEDTTDHLTSGCLILENNECLMKYDNVSAHSHYSTYQALGIKTTEQWHACMHTHTHKPVHEHKDVRVMESRGTCR
jgi:hypothetical protein